MMTMGNLAFWISILGLIVILFVKLKASRDTARFVFMAAVLTACGLLFLVYFQTNSNVAEKGQSSSEPSFVLILYACMLLGMACHYFYNFSTQARRSRKKFDAWRFFGPVFASPIVFIPVLSAFQSVDIDLANLTLPKYMVFLVAFENGFFWREIFNKRSEGVKNGKPSQSEN